MPEEDFAATLAAHHTSPAALETVSLGRMVEAFAGGAGLPAAPPTTTTAPAMATAPSGAARGPAGDTVASPGAEVLAAGERYLGIDYVWGGSDPETGFDCSGLVQQVYADLGVSLPRVSIDQSRAGTEVAGGLPAAREGDLVFWKGDAQSPNHIGIYAGDGEMLVAPSTGDVVRYQEISRPPDAVRRIL